MDNYELNKKTYMDIIKNYLNKVFDTIDKLEKVNVIIDMFKYILSIPEFIAREAKFRLQIEIKMNELPKEVDELQFENKNEFYKLIEQLKIFLDEIKYRKDYISIYDPFIHKIVITL
jgi:hypothetical protein